MGNHIAELLGIRPAPYDSDLLGAEELGYTLGVSRCDALKLTQREDFPDPVMSIHRYEANETLPQPRRVWDRADVERWAKERDLPLPPCQTAEK